MKKAKQAKQRCVMDVGMCLYAQLVQTKNKQCKIAIILQCYHPHLSDFCTMYVSCTVCKIFSVKYWRDLEIWVMGRSRSLTLALFDRLGLHTTYYKSAIVTSDIKRYWLTITIFSYPPAFEVRTLPYTVWCGKIRIKYSKGAK